MYDIHSVSNYYELKAVHEVLENAFGQCNTFESTHIVILIEKNDIPKRIISKFNDH